MGSSSAAAARGRGSGLAKGWATACAAVLGLGAGAAGSGLEVDVQRLLTMDELMPSSTGGPVWEMEPRDGRRLLLLPMRAGQMDEEQEFRQPEFRVRGGGLMAWLVEDLEDQPQRSRSRPGRYEMGRSFGEPASRQRGRAAAFDPADIPADFDPDGFDPDDFLGEVAETQIGPPPGSPRMARAITLRPDGSIAWQLERAMAGAEVVGSDAYAMRLRPDLLMEHQPDRAGARGSREDRLAFREQMQEFQELREHVRTLPDSFELPAGRWQLTGIYQISVNVEELAFTGEGQHMPWTLSFEDLEAFREVAAGQRQGFEALRLLLGEAGSGHALTDRLVAAAAASSGVAEHVRTRNAYERLFRMLMDSDDPLAREYAVAGLAEVTEPNDAVVALLQRGADEESPHVRLTALRGLAHSDPDNTERMASLLEIAEELLASSSGPAPEQVLTELSRPLAGHEEATRQAAGAINFGLLSEQRLEAAIAWAIEQAPHNPVAAAWLDEGLLRATDDAVTERTLARLSQRAEAGPPQSERGDEPLYILIDTNEHGLFEALESSDSTRHSQAWDALSLFSFEPARGQRRMSTRRGEDERHMRLAEAATAVSPTPEKAVTFLDRQRDGQEVYGAWMRLVAEGDGSGAEQAAQRLMGMGGRLNRALEELPLQTRAAFAAGLYEIQGRHAPLATGLLASDSGPRGRSGRNPLTRWFADAVGEGRLPQAAEWGPAFGDESALLETAAQADDERVTNGAIGALVASAGGDDAEALALADRWRDEGSQSLSRLESAWSDARQRIYTQRLSEAEGSFRMQALLRGRARETADDMPPEFYDDPYMDGPGRARQQQQDDRAVTERLTLGVVDLQVEGREVRLSNDIVPLALGEDQLSLVIDPVRELENFGEQQINELDLGNVRQPLMLLPGEEGVWSGQVRLRDGRTLEVRMEPAN